MRYLDPEIDALATVFGQCYERRQDPFGAASWQRVALPDSGGIADQDAWTMQALGFMRDVYNRLEQDLLNDATKRRASKAQATAEMVDG